MKIKNYFIFFLIGIFFLQLFQILYFKKSFFTEKYDVSYWKDRYEHSQYVLPLSKRIIGDDGLYGYAGYRLIKGDNPFSINVDKPPVAKYLIGLSIVTLDNPAYYALFFGLGILLCLYLIAKMLFKETVFSLLPVVLLFLDPLFFSELWKPWIDLPQVFFLLLNIALLLSVDKKKFLFLSFLSGLALGLFIETKPPILLPIIFILETSFFVFLMKKPSQYVMYLLGIGVGILVPYIRYFQLGYGLIDLVRVHKYMLSIYQQSQLIVHKGAIWQTILIGVFPDIAMGNPTTVSEWWIIWPVAVLFSLVFAASAFFKKKELYIEKGLAIFVLGSFVVFTLIPSYPRYLLLVLPVIYLFVVSIVKNFFPKHAQILFAVLVGFYGLFHAFQYLLPDPSETLNNFYYSFSHQYFQDVYQEDLSQADRAKISEKDFREFTQKTLSNASIASIEIKEKQKDVSQDINKGTAKIVVTYKTLRLGSFTQEKTINLIKEDGRWKLQWDFDIILNDYKPSDIVSVAYVYGKRGTIFSHYGWPWAQDVVDGFLISINPDKVDSQREKEMLFDMSNLSGLIKEAIHNGIHENPLPDSYIPVLTVLTKLDLKQMARIRSYQGLHISAIPSRVYDGIDPQTITNISYNECCTKMYSPYNYHGVKGFEKQYDAVLSGYDGGSMVLQDKDGKVKQVLIEKQPKFGEDVHL